MNIVVGKWGNSLGVRIPGSVAKELGLHDGSVVDLQQVGGELVLSPVHTRAVSYDLKEILAQITPETVHGEVEWGAPAGNEEW